MATKYIIYLRVSTAKQGASGLGLEAQKASVEKWIQQHPGEVVATYTEVESGKRDNRAELQKAIQQTRNDGATLLIAKLDRLSRSASFIFSLRDSGINFIAVDLPELNALSLSLFAGLAQWERETISARTKQALQAKKERGVKLGKPENLQNNKAKAEANSAQTRREQALNNQNNAIARRRIKELREMGRTWAEIVKELTESKYLTSSGSDKWSITQVQRLFNQK